MMRGEVSPNGDWLISAERMKAKQEHLIPLSPAARAIVDGMPKLGPYVFTTAGRCPMRNFGKVKAGLDAAMLAEMRKGAQQRGEAPAKITLDPWVIHDLRRTARSLMSRAKINADIAERCLAHVMGGVRGTYDRHSYYDEKRAAFEALAQQVDSIITPPSGNVLPMRRRDIPA
jgi:integrase